MKTHKLFMPNRQIFQHAGPEKGNEALPTQPKPQNGEQPKVDQYKQEGNKATEGAARNLAQLGENKPQELDSKGKDTEVKEPISPDALKEWSKGYPEVKINSENQPIVDAMEKQIVDTIKENNKRTQTNKIAEKVGHKDHQIMTWTDDHEYAYVYDKDHTPHARLFKSPEAKAAAVNIDATVDEVITNKKELSRNDKMYSEVYDAAKPLPTKNGEIFVSDVVDGKKYVLINDKNKYRIFGGKPA